MVGSVKEYIISFADRSQAKTALFLVAFFESSVFPVPPDALLIPMVLRRPREWISLSLLCTLGSVLGGLLGYGIGYLLFDSVGKWLMHSYNMGHGIERFQILFQEYGAFIILLKGLTPIPYKLITIASGIAHYPLHLFILLSTLTRLGRFILVSAAIHYLKPETRQKFEENIIPILTVIMILMLLGSCLALKFL